MDFHRAVAFKQILFGCLSFLVGAATLSAADTRYVARFADGSRHEGNALVNWHDVNAQPQLEGRSLWDAANPFRWLRDRTLSPGTPPVAYLELATGDRFPGSVVGYAAAGDEYDPLPSHFFVEPHTSLRPPGEAPRATIRVVASQVRRIVWQRREQSRYQPSTLLLRDGRSLSYRAIRFDDGFASVLSAEGNRRVPFDDIAEAHLPLVDYWQHWLEELAVLSPQGTTRLYQLETTDGLVATTSKDRLAIRTEGGANEPHRWFHGVQPAWSLDLLWVPNDKVWLRRSFAPNEVLLSRVPPSEVLHQSTLGKLGQPWQRDRNIAGEPLRSGGREWGFGLGCTTTTELIFDLPVGVKSIRGAIGLDRLAGKGGCAKGIISAGKDLQKLWESPPLQGAELAHDFGPLPCPAPTEKQKLVLRADALHQGRPAGADPLEVRDFVDWLDPILEFDPEVLLPLIREKVPSTIPALAQWQVDMVGADAKKAPKFQSFLDPRAPQPGRYRPGVVLEQPMVVSRTLSPEADDQWLVLHVTRPLNQGNEPRLEARIEGELVGEFKVPVHDGNVRPLAVPLLGYRNSKRSEIEVQLTLYSEPSSGPIEWRSLRTAQQLPTLYRVFEEENHFEMVEGGPAVLAPGDTRFGVQALQLPQGSAVQMKFERPLKIRENPSWGEYRQLRFTMRVKGKGSVQIEFKGQDDRTRILHYGPRGDAPKEYVHAQDKVPAGEWMHDLTRDLAGDFGPFNLSAITLRVLEGESAEFDHVYLAAQWNDLELVTRTPTPESLHSKHDPAVVKQLVDKTQPTMVRLDFGDGRIGSGVTTNYTGEVLTAGHLLIAPGRDVKVILADGKEVKGKTRGINRDVDLGMIKIETEGSYPALGVNHWQELGTQQLFVAAAIKPDVKASDFKATAVDVRRNFKGTAWTNFELPGGMVGGPLVDKTGALVGVLTRYSPFGGAEYGLLLKYNEFEGRLRDSNVWGKWRAGTGPSLGLTADQDREGVKTIKLESKGPAELAGVQVGDHVMKVDGQAVLSADNIDTHLAERDAGYEATLELVRNGQPVSVKIKLAPRVP